MKLFRKSPPEMPMHRVTIKDVLVALGEPEIAPMKEKKKPFLAKAKEWLEENWPFIAGAVVVCIFYGTTLDANRIFGLKAEMPAKYQQKK